MNLGIEGKKALVTAGSRGIGNAIACSLADEGAEVAVVSRTEPGVFRHLPYDLMAPGAVGRLLEGLITYPDILVHNLGGTLDVLDPFCTPQEWIDVYQVNLGVAVELNRALVPHMQERGWGRVVHVSSVSALENQGPVTYCAMKAALNAYVRGFGRVVASSGVSVSAVLPGAILTEGGYWETCDRGHANKFLSERMSIGRFGRPEEIGKIVAFLCSEHASFVVGSSWLVDGGQGRAVG